MKKISAYLYMLIAVVVMFISQATVALAQEPTHYPDEHEPIPPTLINILIFIGGPIFLFVIYYYFRKREKRRRRSDSDFARRASSDREETK